MNKAIKIIGIDCATDVKSTGLSVGIYCRFQDYLAEDFLKSVTVGSERFWKWMQSQKCFLPTATVSKRVEK